MKSIKDAWTDTSSVCVLNKVFLRLIFCTKVKANETNDLVETHRVKSHDDIQIEEILKILADGSEINEENIRDMKIIEENEIDGNDNLVGFK